MTVMVEQSEKCRMFVGVIICNGKLIFGFVVWFIKFDIEKKIQLITVMFVCLCGVGHVRDGHYWSDVRFTVIKLVSDLRQVGCFLRILRFNFLHQ